MLSDCNKNIGNSSLGIAISYFTCSGYTNAELLFVVTGDNKLYLIPISEIKNSYTLNLGKEYDKYLLIAPLVGNN